MQLMGKKSEEGNVSGLGWFDEEVIQFNPSTNALYKSLHIGWNSITQTIEYSNILDNITEDDEFYFAHKFHFKNSGSKHTNAISEYGIKFPSVISKENIFGIQFHPEKSHDSGIKIISNFLKI
jgi:glutamine amidotransferase